MMSSKQAPHSSAAAMASCTFSISRNIFVNSVSYFHNSLRKCWTNIFVENPIPGMPSWRGRGWGGPPASWPAQPGRGRGGCSRWTQRYTAPAPSYTNPVIRYISPILYKPSDKVYQLHPMYTSSVIRYISSILCTQAQRLGISAPSYVHKPSD